MAKARTPATAPLLPAQAADRLNALQAHPELAGDRIYRADVFPQGESGAPPLFFYARHVQAIGDDLLASHLTYLPSGDLIIEERVTSSLSYGFQRFDVANRQTGLAGSVVLDAGQNRLRFKRTNSVQQQSERVNAPVVAGPNLHGHILRHWDALAKAERLPVRMAVLARMETLGFDIHKVESNDNVTAFQITPSHFLIRLVVSPLRVVFDNATRRVLRYEGRVPPMRANEQKLVDLDAVVHYHWDTDRYR
ncbi:MAG TPA: hypothetical protein VFY22_00445 [Hydrogenophaga sp.]|nr:hypothetical protein [Hydrogenophaga sp.]